MVDAACADQGFPYERVDPFILVHEGRFRLSPEMSTKDTKHPHRGFDNLWYVLRGSISTGHNTGPGGSMERARLAEGSLLALRAGRGVWHAEALGEDEVEEGLADTRVPRRAVLGEPGPEGQARRTERAGGATGTDPGAAGRRSDRSSPGRRGLSRASGDAGADPRHRIARGRADHDTGAAWVPGLRVRAGGRGRLRGQPAPGETSPTREGFNFPDSGLRHL